MYTLVKNRSIRELITQQAPALIAALIIAELLYKFRSFTLECVAFLFTWYVIDAVITRMLKRV